MNQIKPTAAIISYEGKYAEFHKIKDGKLSIGSPVTRELLGHFKEIISNEDTIKSMNGLIPSNLLYINTSSFDFKMIWVSEQQERHLIFNNFKGYAIVPKMVWSLKNNELSVFFIKQKGATAILYKPIFPNCNSSGVVCFGNVDYKPKSCVFQEVIDKIERSFFNSVFTDENHNYLKDKTKPTEIWKKLTYKQRNPKAKLEFPMDQLIETNLKLEDLWSEYI